jgi:hypothetical protein
MKYAWLLIGGTLAALAWTSPSAQAKPKREEPLVQKVHKAIQGGVRYLRTQQQRSSGSWENYQRVGAIYEGGCTALALLALLNAGVDPKDRAIQRGLEFLRKVEPKHTYVVSLQTMVYVEAGQTTDSERIQRNVDWLIKTRITDNGKLLGWTYGTTGRSFPDNSNSQYAILGLHAGKTAGAKIDREIWQSIRTFYERTQRADGGWNYNERGNLPGGTLTMDIAGLTGLIIAGAELNKGREIIRADGTAKNCGVYDQDNNIRRAVNRISRIFSVELPNRIYYNLYGIERAGRLSGERFLGLHDWYREGCEFLVKKQDQTEGCWPREGNQFDQWPVINTSFALLFLSKGRTPVLISKMVHGGLADRYGANADWNNDRNDIKHLVEYASKNLFKRQPLAWQIFDADRGIRGRTEASLEDRLEAVTSELLQSPIIYFNGHKAPKFTESEIKLLREYVDNGGFIVVEACCGRNEFREGFATGDNALVKTLFPDNELKELEANHPVWTAFYKVDPRVFPLWGIKRGCKTVLIYSPKDLSCYWESNNFKEAKNALAFRLGANIITYATGLEKPVVRGTKQQVVREGKQDVPRNAVRVAQLKYGPDWEPAPNAMRVLLDYMDQEVRINVNPTKAGISVDSSEIVKFKFLYMHGNKAFAFEKDQLQDLKFNLTEGGGLLFADACCGSKTFDKSFRKFIRLLFDKDLEPIPVEKEDLFSEDLNGEKIDEHNIRCRITRAQGNGKAAAPRNMAPALEGIKFEGRWVVIYSKYDIGCALEKHSSPDCLGYDHESALRLGKAAVLYALKR